MDPSAAQQQQHRNLRGPAPQLQPVPTGEGLGLLSPSCRKDPACHWPLAVFAHPFALGPSHHEGLQASCTLATAPALAWSKRSKEQRKHYELSSLLAPHCPCP